MNIRVGGKYETRAGDKVEILSLDRAKKYPFAGCIWFGNDRKYFHWNGFGKYTTVESSMDLVSNYELSELEKVNKLKEILCDSSKAPEEKLDAAEEALEEFNNSCDC